MGIYDFSVKDTVGQDISLGDYRGKVLLIVNTATGCGFTPQYDSLQYLYDKYKDQGLEILDFPCNQFAGQAPGTDEDIVSFCKLKFGVSFKQFSKVCVNGKNEIPLYTYLKEQKSGIGGKRIKWNFTKFLVDRDGNVTDRYAPNVNPKDIEERIVELLG